MTATVIAGMEGILEELSSTPNKYGVLERIDILLSAASRSEVQQWVSNVSITPIFDCFNTDDRKQVQLCEHVLLKVLATMNEMEIFSQFSTELVLGLVHPYVEVQELCVKQIAEAVRINPSRVLDKPLVVPGLLHVLTMSSEQTTVTTQAGNTLCALCGTLDGLEVLCQTENINTILEALRKNSAVALRVLEAIATISVNNNQALDIFERNGVLNELYIIMRGTDILAQLNCLDILALFATNDNGLDFLKRTNMFVEIQHELQANHEDDVMGILRLSGYIKLLCSICHYHPKEMSKSLIYCMMAVFNMCSSNEPAIRMQSVETICFIGSTPEGKLELQKLGSGAKMEGACKQIWSAVSSSTAGFPERILDAVAKLLHLNIEEQTEELLALTERWFTLLETNPLRTIMDKANLPFDTIRCSALRLLDVLANQLWAQQRLNNYPGFKEYLTNRKTEKTKEGKDAKFTIIKTLVESPTAVHVFNGAYFLVLRAYVRDGPFYMETSASVAFEAN